MHLLMLLSIPSSSPFPSSFLLCLIFCVFILICSGSIRLYLLLWILLYILSYAAHVWTRVQILYQHITVFRICLPAFFFFPDRHCADHCNSRQSNLCEKVTKGSLPAARVGEGMTLKELSVGWGLYTSQKIKRWNRNPNLKTNQCYEFTYTEVNNVA